MNNEENGFFVKAGTWVKTSIMLKMIVIGFLMLILLIPTNMVESMIEERSSAREGAVQEVSKKWGRSQTITGPILTVPYIQEKYENGKINGKKYYAHFLPSKILVNGTINPQEKHRGIYDVIIYDSKLDVTGEFNDISIESLHLNDSDMLWDEANISIGVTDMRGITDIVKMRWNGKEVIMKPGIENAQMLQSGVNGSVIIPFEPQEEFPTDQSIPCAIPSQIMKNSAFSFVLHVNGSSNFMFTPIGEQTTVNLKSTWNSPKFDGAFLPQNQEVNDSGFVAQWKVINLNRNYPQQWVKNNYKVDGSHFGVSLILPVDEYQKSLRSAKYASLIILLTFLAFFFIEIANSIKIHPLQYVLVGAALVLFYTLLISISEHFGFNTAYILSTLMVSGLIGMYSSFIFNDRTKASLLTAGLGGIYSFMFFVLNSEDYALLMGSIGLFIILAVVMYSTRNIKFYKSV
jgi:inner membrane protein